MSQPRTKYICRWNGCCQIICINIQATNLAQPASLSYMHARTHACTHARTHTQITNLTDQSLAERIRPKHAVFIPFYIAYMCGCFVRVYVCARACVHISGSQPQFVTDALCL